MFWTPDVDIGTVTLTETPPALLLDSSSLRFDDSPIVTDADGTYIIHGKGLNAVHLMVLAGSRPDGVLSALVPIGAPDAPERLEALARLLRRLASPPGRLRDRLTPQRRHRLTLMFRAVDAHADGETYRTIAEGLFGPARLADEPWKTSPIRDITIRLVRDGLRMVDGGYRRLLRSLRD